MVTLHASINMLFYWSSKQRETYVSNVIKKIEKKAKQSSNYSKNHPIQNDDDGDIINPTPGRNKKINEISSTVTAGPYSAPIEIGLKKWSDSELGPFKEHSKHRINKIIKLWLLKK